MFVLIFVCVGSRSYPFDRLFKKLDILVENNTITDRIFAQIGTSTYIPKNFEYKRYLSPEEFRENIEKSSLVISHGASGSIMQALNSEKPVIAVTRLEKYGEHINDHQIQINEAFSMNGYVKAVIDLDDLDEALESYKEKKLVLKKWENTNKMSVINMVDRFIQENWS